MGVPALNAVLIGAFIGVAALSWPGLRPYGLLFTPERWPIAGPDLPVAAADYVATLPATRFYNYMDWGGYLGWRLAPRQRIFVRFNFFPPRFYRDYFTIANAAPGWSELLVAYGADGLIVSRADQPALLRALAATDAWQAVYCDAQVAVFLPPATAPGPAVACDAE